MSKRKGSASERELLHRLWENGFAVVRAAGSGSGSWPSPDLMAVKNSVNYAIECKSTVNGTLYVAKEKIDQLLEFSNLANAKPIIAVKFINKGWRFFEPGRKNYKFEEGKNDLFQTTLAEL